MTAPLVFTDVTFSYRKRPIFQGLNLELQPGFTALLGPNGAGKSTMLNLAAGSLRPQGGVVELLGHRTSIERERALAGQGLGFAPQYLEVGGRLTVMELMRYVGWLRRVSPPQQEGLIDQALARTGLDRHRNEQVRRLSGGTRQRLNLAQAILGEPRILLLDEPTTGLDPAERARWRQALGELPSSTVLLSTHIVADVLGLCDRVIVLTGSCVGFDGTIQELCGGCTPNLETLEAAYLRLQASS